MQNTFIRKTCAGFLLAMFVFCNTPTAALHALFANHKDQASELNTHAQGPQWMPSGIDCHCYSNVVTAPYIFQLCSLGIAPPVAHPVYRENLKDFIAAGNHLSLTLRGPPSLNRTCI